MDLWRTSIRQIVADFGGANLFDVPNCPNGWQSRTLFTLDPTVGRSRFQPAKRELVTLLGVPESLPIELEPPPAKVPPKSGRLVCNGRRRFADAEANERGYREANRVPANLDAACALRSG
jgi:hypothetical protein